MHPYDVTYIQLQHIANFAISYACFLSVCNSMVWILYNLYIWSQQWILHCQLGCVSQHGMMYNIEYFITCSNKLSLWKMCLTQLMLPCSLIVYSWGSKKHSHQQIINMANLHSAITQPYHPLLISFPWLWHKIFHLLFAIIINKVFVG